MKYYNFLDYLMNNILFLSSIAFSFFEIMNDLKNNFEKNIIKIKFYENI